MPDTNQPRPGSGPVRVLIVVDSWTGHTARVAKRVADGVRSEGGEVVTRSADEATRADLQAADALVMGSAVHQRTMTWKMKRFVDEVCEAAWFYDDVVGRVGAVFTAGGGTDRRAAGRRWPSSPCSPTWPRAGWSWSRCRNARRASSTRACIGVRRSRRPTPT